MKVVYFFKAYHLEMLFVRDIMYLVLRQMQPPDEKAQLSFVQMINDKLLNVKPLVFTILQCSVGKMKRLVDPEESVGLSGHWQMYPPKVYRDILPNWQMYRGMYPPKGATQPILPTLSMRPTIPPAAPRTPTAELKSSLLIG